MIVRRCSPAKEACLSDERLQIVVTNARRVRELQGRVLIHGEEEQGSGASRHYMLLEGTDARVHLLYYTPEMEEARSRGKLRVNNFVRLATAVRGWAAAAGG